MSVGLIALVCGISFSAVNTVNTISDIDTIKAVTIISNGFTIATVFFGCLMIYAVFSVSFDGRMKIIGLLTSIGMSDAQKCVMIFIETLIYGICGSMLGIILGLSGAKLFYENGANIISSWIGTDVKLFIITPACVILSAVLGILSTLTASLVPMLKIRRISIMDSIHERTKINISLKQGLFSRITEKLFGRLGKLAGQNYDNHKGKYRAISLSLSGGTIFFFAIYCFFMYPIRFDIEHGYPKNDGLYALFSMSIVLAILFILIFLICASGSAAINIDRRKNEFAMLKSIGMQNSELCRMMCIESIFLVYYSAIYGLIGSLFADWLICNFFRITDEPNLKFWYPVLVFCLFVLLDIIVGLLFAVYSVVRVKKINIVQTIKNKI